jgi:ATP-binding cassette subfamily B protein
VVKVFCHEEQAKKAFDVKNEGLFEDSTAANKYANILMPIMNNLGYALYVLLAVVVAPWRLAESETSDCPASAWLLWA